MSFGERCTEEAMLFACAGETLVGVLTRPQIASGFGVVIIIGGPQYRAGSHRQFVLLARSLADAGHTVLRFDCRGMGDSSGALRDFLAINEDIGAAIDALQRAAPSLRRMALLGLCDAASAALLYWHKTRDVRVERMILLNPWVRSQQGLARTQIKHYYHRRLLEFAFWVKLASGKVGLGAFAGLVRNLKAAVISVSVARGGAAATEQPFTSRMAAAWNEFGGEILLLLSGNDYTAKEFLELARSDPAWQKALECPRLLQREIKQADHTFSNTVDARLVEQYALDWLKAEDHAVRLASLQRSTAESQTFGRSPGD